MIVIYRIFVGSITFLLSFRNIKETFRSYQSADTGKLPLSDVSIFKGFLNSVYKKNKMLILFEFSFPDKCQHFMRQVCAVLFVVWFKMSVMKFAVNGIVLKSQRCR